MVNMPAAVASLVVTRVERVRGCRAEGRRRVARIRLRPAIGECLLGGAVAAGRCPGSARRTSSGEGLA